MGLLRRSWGETGRWYGGSRGKHENTQDRGESLWSRFLIPICQETLHIVFPQKTHTR
jgi:hypothetical protein